MEVKATQKPMEEGANTEKASNSGHAVVQMEEISATPSVFNKAQFTQKLEPSAALHKVTVLSSPKCSSPLPQYPGSLHSSLADLIKFNAAVAHSFYQVSEEDGLETVLYILQAEENVKVRLLCSNILLSMFQSP